MSDLQIIMEIGAGAAHFSTSSTGNHKSVAVFSIVSLEGWGSISKEASIAFSMRLSEALSKLDDLRGSLSSTALELFRTLLQEFKVPYPGWASGSFCVLARTKSSWICSWVGGVRCVFFLTNVPPIRSLPHEMTFVQSDRATSVFTRQLTATSCDTPSWMELGSVGDGGWGYLSDDTFATEVETLVKCMNCPAANIEAIRSGIVPNIQGTGVLLQFSSHG